MPEGLVGNKQLMLPRGCQICGVTSLPKTSTEAEGLTLQSIHRLSPMERGLRKQFGVWRVWLGFILGSLRVFASSVININSLPNFLL